MVVPALTGIDVKAGTAPPLLGNWAWRAGWSSVVVLALVGLTTWRGLVGALDRLTWRKLLALSWVMSVVWMVVLALVDGPGGLGRILDHGTEYLQSARAVDDVVARPADRAGATTDRTTTSTTTSSTADRTTDSTGDLTP